jgi:hypothetical protein
MVERSSAFMGKVSCSLQNLFGVLVVRSKVVRNAERVYISSLIFQRFIGTIGLMKITPFFPLFLALARRAGRY